MLKKDPVERITCKDALAHKYFSEEGNFKYNDLPE